MHNTRKLEEMSNFEARPQRLLLNKTNDIVECVCLWFWVSVCALHPLRFESFYQFYCKTFRAWVSMRLCPVTHLEHFLNVIVKQQNMTSEVKIMDVSMCQIISSFLRWYNF